MGTPEHMTQTPAPKRIQLSRKKGWRKPKGTIVVSRPSRWGNPYRVDRISATEWACVFLSDEFGPLAVGADTTREEALAKVISAYRGLVEDGYFGTLNGLRGHDLGCWCPLDQPCHADVLLEFANRN